MKKAYIWLLSVSTLLMAIDKERFSQPIKYMGDVAENYIVRWEFQKYGDFVYDPWITERDFATKLDEGVTFDPALVQAGDRVFARNPRKFFKKMHPQITKPYLLIVHGLSHDRFREELIPYLDDPKIIACFTIHPPEQTHPKLYHLPLGVMQNRELYSKKQKMNERYTAFRENPKKKHLLYCNFLNRTHPSRKGIKNYFLDKSYCFHRDMCSFKEYVQDVADSVFVLSPQGRAIDANRTWETLLAGSIPIVQSSQLNDLYEGLPVVVVEDFTSITKEFLIATYDEIMTKEYDLRRLYCDYWFEKIEEVREEFLRTYQPT